MPTKILGGLAYMAPGLTSRNNSPKNTMDLGYQGSFFTYPDWAIRELVHPCHQICQQYGWHKKTKQKKTPVEEAQRLLELSQGKLIIILTLHRAEIGKAATAV